MSLNETAIAQATTLLRQSRHAVALTGAGISTPSGIPDFRSVSSGLWDVYDPMEVASIYAFRRQPQAFYDWLRPLARAILNARPNPAHQALARMEAHGPLKAVITQNIDMLHTRAGSQMIYEVHGHLRTATCRGCGAHHDGPQLLTSFVADGAVPICHYCMAVLKPDVVLYGETLPLGVYVGAEEAAVAADLMLVVGSSLEVVPVSDLPRRAKQTGAALIIVNYEPTPADGLADVVIRGDVAEVLPRLAAGFGSQ